MTLFSSIYRDEHWDICPQNPANNINVTHKVTRFDAQTLNNSTLFDYQERFVRKSSQPEELPPELLTETYVRLSPHTALIIQSASNWLERYKTRSPMSKKIWICLVNIK